MKIEEGKFYKTRDGNIVGPMEGDGTGQWFHHEGSKGGFRPDGKSFVGMDADLIAPAYVEQGTLKELNIKPGDQLVFVEEGENKIGYHYQKGYLVEVEEDGTVYGCSPELCDATWRVVSRAPNGPVRTVTTTRKEVVQGVYGIVSVDVEDGFVGVEISVAGPSTTELRAAAKTLVQIADAL